MQVWEWREGVLKMSERKRCTEKGMLGVGERDRKGARKVEWFLSGRDEEV